jgi:6-phosphogluconolactonase
MPNNCLLKSFFILLGSFLLNFHSNAQSYLLFTGTYTSGTSEGIYVYKFDAATGRVSAVDTVRQISNPSYLTLSDDGRFLYAVSENGGKTPGMVAAFSVDPAIGTVKALNQMPSKGDFPCYITVSKNRKWVIAANYGGGSLVAYEIKQDGSLSDHYQLIQHTGTGPNKERQEAPHVHSTIFSPDQHYLFAPDLGIDQVSIYRFDASDKEPLTPAKQPFAAIKAGNGPRHIAFHPNKKWMYVIEEMGGTVSAWNYHKGTMKEFQRIDAHPEGYSGDRGSADIHVSPDGNYLYASNRFQANNITIFKIDQNTGRLTVKGFQDVLGKKPRNFIIDPTGQYVIVANQESNDIRFFRRDIITGLLAPTNTVINVGSPVCLQLLALPSVGQGVENPH